MPRAGFGTRDMPLVKDKYHEIGLEILHAKITPITPTASNSYPGSPPSSAVDGDVGTSWNAGSAAPQWIQLDLGQEYPISKVRMKIAQYPSGHTTHLIYGGSILDTLTQLYTFDGDTQDEQWLEALTPVTNIRYLKIETTISPSWVAWYEIEVYR